MTSGENFRKKKEEQRREEERKKKLMNFGKRNPEGQHAKKRILFICLFCYLFNNR